MGAVAALALASLVLGVIGLGLGLLAILLARPVEQGRTGDQEDV